MAKFFKSLRDGQRRSDSSWTTSSSANIDDYSVNRKLGRGSFATVFLARDRRTGGMVALKKMKINDPTAHAEITILKKLPKHENVVTMIDYFEDRGTYGGPKLYLVLEYCDGGSLNSMLKNEHIPLDLAFEYMQDIVAGVCHLHQNSIIHCDLKADNILFSPGQRRDIAKVTDFSIGRKLERSGRDSVKLSPHLKYGPHYSSAPEVWDGSQVTDRSDIYSLGLVLLSFFVHSSITSTDGRSYLMTPFCLSKRLYGKALRQGPQQEADGIVDEYVIPSMKNVVMACLSKDFRLRPFAEEVLRDIAVAADLYEPGSAVPMNDIRTFTAKWHR